MTYKFQYNTPEERQSIIDAHADLIRIEEDNITEGNFLIFSDTKRTENIIKDELDNQLTIMEAIADLYETIATTTA